ncbi:MAG TPA: SagB/ThcOx family dehydrogenase [Candidatus Dormibacteraeota bacterium]|nr:SagB/ThcOx family dehydrogenase [Candidatus Dormibacteraeota bacterium]
MARTDDVELFELFWENSKLNPVTIAEFGRRINAFAADGRPDTSLDESAADVQLESPRDALQKLMFTRRSVRSWSSRPVSMKQLGALMAAFAKSQTGMRAYPSAGATYAVEVYCLLNQVEGELRGKVVRYHADNHSLSVVGVAPSDEEIRDLINLEGAAGAPPLVFVIALIAERTTAKYGERGGRFALIEAGQALQNLALRIEAEGLAGVELGGLLDDRVRALLKLDRKAKIALGYACGHPA